MLLMDCELNLLLNTVNYIKIDIVTLFFFNTTEFLKLLAVLEVAEAACFNHLSTGSLPGGPDPH